MRECEEQKKGHSQTRKDIYVLYELKEGSEIHWRVEVQRRADYTGSPSLKYFPYSAKNVHTLKKLACNCLTLEGGWMKHTDGFSANYNNGFIHVRKNMEYSFRRTWEDKMKIEKDNRGKDINREKEGIP